MEKPYKAACIVHMPRMSWRLAVWGLYMAGIALYYADVGACGLVLYGAYVLRPIIWAIYGEYYNIMVIWCDMVFWMPCISSAMGGTRGDRGVRYADVLLMIVRGVWRGKIRITC